jgi:hypothetical protein
MPVSGPAPPSPALRLPAACFPSWSAGLRGGCEVEVEVEAEVEVEVEAEVEVDGV